MTWLGTAAHARWLETESRALLDFARAAAVPQGFGYLDAEGRLDPSRPVELWVTCRMTHCFSLGTLLGVPGTAPLADHGVRALSGALRDAEHGGWFSAVGPDGPVNDAKEAYAHAFVVLATSSATAAGRPGARELLTEALRVSEERFWREDEGAVLESWDRGFTTAEEYRGVNANMHTVEAYLAAADVTGEDVWLDRAVRILRRVLDGYARDHDWRIPEHFTRTWEPVPDYNADDPAHPFRPFGVTVGHGLEWARLALHAREGLVARGRETEGWLLEAAQGLFDRATGDGWDADGADGFVYTVDFTGQPVVHERMHWVVCEAIGAAAALEAVTGEERYAQWYQRAWDYAATHLIERPGAWRHELDEHNTPSARTWPGKPDTYHALQATLVPRLPLAPAFAPALAAGLLDVRHPLR
ncbi:AGE family epimerase/isomerase [Georgenia sp. 311]|uniref:AGE family epimerase/isomerase n=1 Tax=Georgenia sp. 311 TaxID=2585134 RepID=UPI0011118E6E|nr:AGE family epimerase/isomerase [Georgenia sp. 311]TNC17978.1 AGE family epimerase/isomerase [Georgenia sp. 311]